MRHKKRRVQYFWYHPTYMYVTEGSYEVSGMRPVWYDGHIHIVSKLLTSVKVYAKSVYYVNEDLVINEDLVNKKP